MTKTRTERQDQDQDKDKDNQMKQAIRGLFDPLIIQRPLKEKKLIVC